MPELAELAEQISANLLSHGLRKRANKLTDLIDLTPAEDFVLSSKVTYPWRTVTMSDLMHWWESEQPTSGRLKMDNLGEGPCQRSGD